MSNQTLQPLICDRSLANDFIHAVVGTIDIYFGVPTVPTRISFDEVPKFEGMLIGMMPMQQVLGYEATLMVAFEPKVVFDVLSKLYNREVSTINKTVTDGVGEITNTIFGILKGVLNQRGHAFQMSIPSVVVDVSRLDQKYLSTSSLFIPFSTSNGMIFGSIVRHEKSSDLQKRKLA